MALEFRPAKNVLTCFRSLIYYKVTLYPKLYSEGLVRLLNSDP